MRGGGPLHILIKQANIFKTVVVPKIIATIIVATIIAEFHNENIRVRIKKKYFVYRIRFLYIF